jgi:hypothetical protein
VAARGARAAAAAILEPDGDPSVHYAFGEFADMDALRQTMRSEGFKFLLADYDRVWSSRGVTRTRDILEKVQHLARGTASP